MIKIKFLKILALLVFLSLLGKSCGRVSSEGQFQAAEEELERSPDPKIDFSRERKEYISGYDDEIIIRDTLLFQGDEYQVFLKNYCEFDSALIIPKEYIWEKTSFTSFTSHNFSAEIIIYKNSEEFLKRTLTKETFKELLPENIYNYGRLFAPNFRGFEEQDEQFKFGFSISIPVTDLGRGVEYQLKLNGNSSVSP